MVTMMLAHHGKSIAKETVVYDNYHQALSGTSNYKLDNHGIRAIGLTRSLMC